ncbi:lipoprotein [Atlantibacter subterranea]|uniref:lipoprotein n=1 Tax=Atlantibacter subterraneus TaxID=255519 RepID=UPI0020C2D6B6|nr:lipoprotein [Atlantibacter subterranea]UTJ45968.1 lipoprotein [Atlantibacter subterranea]
MRPLALTLVLPCALLLSACATDSTTAFKDIGTRSGPCVEGGPDSVAQKFYDYRIANPAVGTSNLGALRPWLSDDLYAELQKASTDSTNSAFLRSDIYSSHTIAPSQASVSSASTIPNTDARNIPLRVALNQGSERWQDEVLMIREGQCWAVDDVRYLGGSVHAPAGTLRQSIENDLRT